MREIDLSLAESRNVRQVLVKETAFEKAERVETMPLRKTETKKGLRGEPEKHPATKIRMRR